MDPATARDRDHMTIRTNSDDVATVDNGQDSARERLLDIAEQKFAEKGYFGTGLREIATAAGTTLGLINHHFGNKEALFRHVIERRASEHVATAFAALDAVVANAGDRPPAIEDVIRAYIQPSIHRSVHDGPGWKNYMQLLGRAMHSRQYEKFMEPLNTIYDPFTKRFIDIVLNVFPDSARDQVYWAFYILQSSYIHIVVESGLIDRQSNGLCHSSDLERATEEMVMIFSAGFRARLSAPSA